VLVSFLGVASGDPADTLLLFVHRLPGLPFFTRTILRLSTAVDGKKGGVFSASSALAVCFPNDGENSLCFLLGFRHIPWRVDNRITTRRKGIREKKATSHRLLLRVCVCLYH
jgi:hypothetical protein